MPPWGALGGGADAGTAPCLFAISASEARRRDSESRLRASLAEMATKQGAVPASTPAPSAPAAPAASPGGDAGAHAGPGGHQP